MREINRISRDRSANEIGFAFYVEVEWPTMFFRQVVAKSEAETTKGASIYLSN